MREWWVGLRDDAVKPELVRYVAHNQPGPDSVHVIEKSAYDALKAEIENLKPNSLGSFDVAVPSDEWYDTIKERDVLKAALIEILNEGNMAMQGNWDSTTMMKEIAWKALRPKEKTENSFL